MPGESYYPLTSPERTNARADLTAEIVYVRDLVRQLATADSSADPPTPSRGLIALLTLLARMIALQSKLSSHDEEDPLAELNDLVLQRLREARQRASTTTAGRQARHARAAKSPANASRAASPRELDG